MVFGRILFFMCLTITVYDHLTDLHLLPPCWYVLVNPTNHETLSKLASAYLVMMSECLQKIDIHQGALCIVLRNIRLCVACGYFKFCSPVRRLILVSPCVTFKYHFKNKVTVLSAAQ